jgi:hypothetical protein
LRIASSWVAINPIAFSSVEGLSVDEFIAVRVVTLRQLFSGEYTFHLPWFQRAYAWQTQEAGGLLTDLFDVAYEEDEKKRRYFLGNLMLARRPGDATTALVDGHQRVMTLTLLFAVLRDLANDPANKATLQGLIGEPTYRLQPQENLSGFCHQFVQAPGGTELTPDAEQDALSETERNIIENRDYFAAELSSPDVAEESRALLFDTLADRCFVVINEVHDEDEAWRMLVVEEETRRDFNSASRSKASLLSIVPQEEREACRKIWEDCELKLGPQDMHELLRHLRTLKLKKQSERPIETDLAKAFSLNKSGLTFMNEALAPAAAQLQALRRHEVGTLKSRAAISDSIKRLTWVAEDLWVPAAIRWIDRRGENGETDLFFKKLKRLVWLMRLAGIDPTRQHRRVIQLIAEIDKDLAVGDMRELEIGRSMRDTAWKNLRSNTFDSKHYAAKMLRRISLELGQDPGPICPDKVTIEHVLPRGWLAKSSWRKHFKTEADVKAYAHQIGNLTFLTGSENREADSCDWGDKRKIYEKTEFFMSRELVPVADWTPAVIVARTDRLSRLLFKSWGLDT